MSGRSHHLWYSTNYTWVWILKTRLHMRFLMRFLMRFRVQNVTDPTLHESLFREASCGLERKVSHIIWRHPSFEFLPTWRYFVAALRDHKPVRSRLGQVLYAKSHQNRMKNRMCKRALIACFLDHADVSNGRTQSWREPLCSFAPLTSVRHLWWLPLCCLAKAWRKLGMKSRCNSRLLTIPLLKQWRMHCITWILQCNSDGTMVEF